MGLDMHLTAKRYLWTDADAETAKKIAEQFPELDTLRVKAVIVEAIYWRKANAIHKWFVDNIQDGEDDCGTYEVSREQLKELAALIREVLKSGDTSKLPPTEGFFFGSTDIDDWYWKDLNDTAEKLEGLFARLPDSWWFEYRSSW